MGFYCLYVPYYIILKLDVIADDNINEKVQQDILSYEDNFYNFIKFDLPLWLFKSNIMVPYMILNRENGSITQNCNPKISKVWKESF